MKVLALTCRVLLGLLFLVFGLNGFFHFIPMGAMPPATSPAGMWMAAMMTSGWMKWIAGFQVLGGVLVLIGGTLPLGLCILCPMTVNILLFHMLMAGGHGIGAGLLAALLELLLIYFYRASFGPILSANQQPVV
jgi:uncharacterized membrane protein YphA (DoxX/SURF4 family)